MDDASNTGASRIHYYCMMYLQLLFEGEECKMAKTVLGREDLEMALVGYEAEKRRVAALIATIQTQLGQRGPGRPKAGPDGSAPAPRKGMSAAARKRVAAAQRKRWAAYRKEMASAKPKRHISEAGRKAMAAGGRRRWAVHR